MDKRKLSKTFTFYAEEVLGIINRYALNLMQSTAHFILIFGFVCSLNILFITVVLFICVLSNRCAIYDFWRNINVQDFRYLLYMKAVDFDDMVSNTYSTILYL